MTITSPRQGYSAAMAWRLSRRPAVSWMRVATTTTATGAEVATMTIVPVKQINGDWRADIVEEEAPLCTISFVNEMAELSDEQKRELVMALIRRYCQDDM